MVNAFWLDRDLDRTARWLVDDHVLSSVFESAMVLTTAVQLNGYAEDDPAVRDELYFTHPDHPLTQWAAAHTDNWEYLREYAAAAHAEWRYRWDHPPEKTHGSWRSPRCPILRRGRRPLARPPGTAGRRSGGRRPRGIPRLRLQVGYQRHFDPVFRELKRLVTGGRIGEIHAANAYLGQDWIEIQRGAWRTDPALSGGGRLYDSGSHLLDALLWTLDAEPGTVAAVTDDRGEDVDVNSALAATLERGAAAPVTASVGVGDQQLQDFEVGFVEFAHYPSGCLSSNKHFSPSTGLRKVVDGEGITFKPRRRTGPSLRNLSVGRPMERRTIFEPRP